MRLCYCCIVLEVDKQSVSKSCNRGAFKLASLVIQSIECKVKLKDTPVSLQDML